MANLRDVKKRIKSVSSTQQITKAMKMVSAAKLRRAQEAITAARPFANKMAEVIASLAMRTSPDAHPLLEVRDAKKAAIIVITSDRGLCGSFNTNILKKADELIGELKAKGKEAVIIPLSRKANEYYKKSNVEILKYFEGVLGELTYQPSREISEFVMSKFLENEIDEIHIVFTQFKSAITQEIVSNQLLPLADSSTHGEEYPVEYIFEPSANEILDELLNNYIVTQTLRAVLDSIASEHGARMTAMDSATNNASDMIKKLTLLYNRARQASITTELVEIVSGAEALKG